jgi:beta-glucanase (GH16 family)
MINKTLSACLLISVLTSCSTGESTRGTTKGTENLPRITSPQIYAVKAPVAGNYPQGLFKYPYKAKSLAEEQFTQTLEWSPKVIKTFATDTKYTATLTLDPASAQHTFEGTTLADVRGLPVEGVENGGISVETRGRSLVVRIEFEKTADEKAAAQIVFSDDFDGTSLNTNKWELCPEWDRQGRSSWRDDMVSVSGGNLHIKFRLDKTLGASKSANKTLVDNWIRAGGIRSRKKDGYILFDSGYGYYEARIKFPVVSGTWGAFWLMSPTQHLLGDEGVDGTEIDIVESIHNENGEYNAALHWNGYDDKHKSTGSGEGAKPVNIYDGQFHVFALDWSPSEYVFYVDGKEFWRADGGSQFKNAGINQNPNYIKLTVEGADWAGSIPSNFTEGEMLVDYVRVYNQPKNGS